MNKTAHQVISEIALYGPSEKESKLEYESSDYLCLACSLTPYGTVNSEVASVEFATGKVSPSDNQIEIVLGTVTSDAVSFNITTTNSDPYAVFMKPSSNFKGKRDEEIIAYFKDRLREADWSAAKPKVHIHNWIVVLNILFLHLDIKDSL